MSLYKREKCKKKNQNTARNGLLQVKHSDHRIAHLFSYKTPNPTTQGLLA